MMTVHEVSKLTGVSILLHLPMRRSKRSAQNNDSGILWRCPYGRRFHYALKERLRALLQSLPPQRGSGLS